MGIAVAGNMILDLYKVVDTYPASSSLTSIRSITPARGGLLCNCAVDLARLDPELDIPVIGIVGNDAEGETIVAGMAEYPNIDLSGIHREGTTSFTDVMEDRNSGTRTFFQYRGANDLLDIHHFDFDSLDAKILHVGYALLLDTLDGADQEYGTRLARLLAMAQERGICTSLDAVSEDSDRFSSIIPPALKYTDYCVINEFEAARVTGLPITQDGEVRIEIIKKAAERLFEMGVGTWVVVHWRDGAAGLDVDGRWVVRPSSSLRDGQIVTRTGAGDAFASGVLYGAHQELSLAEAIEMGLGTAANSLLCGNATDGIGLAASMIAFYRDGAVYDRPQAQG